MTDDEDDANNLKTVFKNEVKVLKKLDHPNIIKLKDFAYKSKLPGQETKISFLSLEIAENGSLFNYIKTKARMSEEVARFNFQQLIDALEHVHKKGYAHRDVKLENILLDANFNIKLADFGLASKSKTSSTRKGTIAYMSPEIISKSNYNTCEADIYAAAIVLFIMISQNCPFMKAEASDRSYSKILSGKWPEFWNSQHLFCNSEVNFSEDFKDLFSKMVAVNPTDRLTIDEIRQHKWFSGPKSSPEEIQKLLESGSGRSKNKKLHKSVIEKSTKGSSKNSGERAIKYTKYFKGCDAEILIGKLIDFAAKYKYKSKRCPEYFRVMLKISSLPKDTLIQMNVLRKPEEESRCVEVIMVSGCPTKFDTVFSQLKRHLYRSKLVTEDDE